MSINTIFLGNFFGTSGIKSMIPIVKRQLTNQFLNERLGLNLIRDKEVSELESKHHADMKYVDTMFFKTFDDLVAKGWVGILLKSPISTHVIEKRPLSIMPEQMIIFAYDDRTRLIRSDYAAAVSVLTETEGIVGFFVVERIEESSDEEYSNVRSTYVEERHIYRNEKDKKIIIEKIKPMVIKDLDGDWSDEEYDPDGFGRDMKVVASTTKEPTKDKKKRSDDKKELKLCPHEDVHKIIDGTWDPKRWKVELEKKGFIEGLNKNGVWNCKKCSALLLCEHELTILGIDEYVKVVDHTAVCRYCDAFFYDIEVPIDPPPWVETFSKRVDYVSDEYDQFIKVTRMMMMTPSVTDGLIITEIPKDLKAGGERRSSLPKKEELLHKRNKIWTDLDPRFFYKLVLQLMPIRQVESLSDNVSKLHRIRKNASLTQIKNSYYVMAVLCCILKLSHRFPKNIKFKEDNLMILYEQFVSEYFMFSKEVIPIPASVESFIAPIDTIKTVIPTLATAKNEFIDALKMFPWIEPYNVTISESGNNYIIRGNFPKGLYAVMDKRGLINEASKPTLIGNDKEVKELHYVSVGTKVLLKEKPAEKIVIPMIDEKKMATIGGHDIETKIIEKSPELAGVATKPKNNGAIKQVNAIAKTKRWLFEKGLLSMSDAETMIGVSIDTLLKKLFSLDKGAKSHYERLLSGEIKAQVIQPKNEGLLEYSGEILEDELASSEINSDDEDEDGGMGSDDEDHSSDKEADEDRD